MGSIESYDTANGRRYRVLYRRPDRRQTQKRGFKTKRAAESFLATTEVDILHGRYIDPALARITIAEWMKTWLATRTDLRATTRSRVSHIIDKHIAPVLGPIRLDHLNRLRVQEWASSLPGSPATVRKIVNVLSGALKLAVEDGRLPTNPAERLKLPKVVKTAKRYLTHDQVAALALEVGRISEGRRHGYHLVILVLAYCGLRWGELSGLRVRDVDLERGRLTIRQTVVADRGYQRIEAPKDYEQRSTPIPAFLRRMLVPHLAGRGPDEPVFYGIRTRTWLRNHVFRVGWFDPAATAIGLNGLTPHELRHTAASLAVSSGAHVKAVQRILGHASASVTLDVYADLFDEDLDTVAVALDRVAMQSMITDLLQYNPSAWEQMPPLPEQQAMRPGLER